MKKLRSIFIISMAILGLLPLLAFQPEMFRRVGGKDAHALHYEGNLAFREGNFKEAVDYFSQAEALVPNNYDFQLSLALAHSRNGDMLEAARLLGKVKIDDRDPFLNQRNMMLSFFKGMVNAYNRQYGKAIREYRNALKWKPKTNDPELASMIHNAMGYAMVLNQGGGSHGKDLPPHLHVHERDMFKALEEFRLAILADPENLDAQYNYAKLRDSLGVSDDLAYGDLAPVVDMYPGMIDNVEKAFDLLHYDELAFLVDISGSMIEERVSCNNYSRFGIMKGTMQLMLNNMPQNVSLGLGTIGGMCDEAPAFWHPTGELGIEQMQYVMRKVVPEGSTPLFSMLRQAPKLFSDDEDNRKAIFLISDGANMCPSGAQDVCEWVAELPDNITINILTFLSIEEAMENQEAFSEYACLANQTGGKVLYIDSYRCRLELYEYSMLHSNGFKLPDMERLDCWGPAVENLWGIMQ